MNFFLRSMLLIILFSNMIFTFSFADWFTPYYEDKNESYIGSGVKHENILRFTDKGWLNVNTVRVNLKDRYSSLDLLTNKEGLQTRKPLSEILQQNENIIAAINGDFYNTQGAATLGPMVSNGKLLATPFYILGQMATFNMTKDNTPFMDYWEQPSITITNENTMFEISIAAINKETESSDIAVLYSHEWGLNTPPLSSKLSSGIELAISQDRILDIYPAGPNGNPIPRDGYIVFATGNNASIIENSFTVGDKIDFKTLSKIDYEDLSLAIGGGSILVKDGLITDVFSHEITGNQPRTAIGISEDNREIILVTVDGRTASFPGVSQRELAQIMINLGAHSALNMDGGGSTEMLLRPLAKSDIIVANNLADGRERNITNGLGVISTAPRTSLKGLKLETVDNNVFINTSREITISGYDNNYNFVEINPSSVNWSVEEASGRIVNGVFTPISSGKVFIKAQYRGIEATIAFTVLDNLNEITVNPNPIKLSAKGQTSISVKGIDKDGYTAQIDLESINFNLSNSLGSIDKISGILQSSNNDGTGILEASYGNLKTYVPIIIGNEQTIIEDFEKYNGSFLSYPSDVTGSYNLVSFSKEGTYSGQIIYDFMTTDATRAAYLVFDNNGITLDRKPESIGLWVYGNSGGHGLKSKITDAKGISENITFTNSIDWSGWQYVEAKIPASLTAPLKIERIYVVEINPIIKDRGQIYIDNLTASYPLTFRSELPAPTTNNNFDLANRKADLQSPTAFRFYASGNITEINSMKDFLVLSKLRKEMNEKSALNVFSGIIDTNLTSQLTNPVIIANGGYSYTKYNKSGFITLDNNKSSFREANANQWPWLLNTLNNIDVNNIFITLPNGFVFKDPLEEKLFKETIEKVKEENKTDIWILCGGKDTFKVYLENGIHYVTLQAFPTNKKFDIYTQIDTMIFTVNDDEVTYEILPLYTLKSN